VGLHLEDAEADVGRGEDGSEIVSAIELEGNPVTKNDLMTL
jgi:hypothetical protein